MPFYYSLFFNSAAVVGDAFRADLLDNVAQLLFCFFKDIRVVRDFKVFNDLKDFLPYYFIWLL